MIDGVNERRRMPSNRVMNGKLIGRQGLFEDRLGTTNYEIIGGIFL